MPSTPPNVLAIVPVTNTRAISVMTNDNLLHVVAKVGHGDKRISPYCFLGLAACRRQSSRRVDYCVGEKQIVECVEVSRIPAASHWQMIVSRKSDMQE